MSDSEVLKLGAAAKKFIFQVKVVLVKKLPIEFIFYYISFKS